MSFATGRFGIEYNPDARDERSPAPGRIIALVVAAAAVSLAVTVVKRVRARSDDDSPPPPVQTQTSQPPPPATPGGNTPLPPGVETGDPRGYGASTPGGIERRPPRVRNLLLKLEKAEASQDVAMCVSTIEQLRALPGEPVADIDDRLARRLGELNVKWLFELKNAQWVKEVTVKSGDSATRIARENASTLASLRRLNPKTDVERLRTGAKVLVMNQPRFNLVVHKRTRTADLQLNGKFFKRYDLRDAVGGAPGAQVSSGNLRQLLADNGVWFNRDDRSEIELLMPKGSSLTISEL